MDAKPFGWDPRSGCLTIAEREQILVGLAQGLSLTAIARLMRAEGIEGARRTKRVRTTKAEPGAARHPDLVNRDFTATAPNQLWVTDLTYVPTWAGVALSLIHI